MNRHILNLFSLAALVALTVSCGSEFPERSDEPYVIDRSASPVGPDDTGPVGSTPGSTNPGTPNPPVVGNTPIDKCNANGKSWGFSSSEVTRLCRSASQYTNECMALTHQQFKYRSTLTVTACEHSTQYSVECLKTGNAEKMDQFYNARTCAQAQKTTASCIEKYQRQFRAPATTYYYCRYR